MKLYRKHSLASALAMAVCLSACDGGTNIVMRPPPAPAPTPPPPPAEMSIEAATQAVLPDAGSFPQAQAGGPTIEAHSSTTFPLIESAVTISSTGLAAKATGSGELTFEATGDVSDAYSLHDPGAGLSNVDLTAGGWYCYSPLCGYSGSSQVELDIADSASTNLTWTTYGFWSSLSSSSITWSAFVTGYKTPLASVPLSGTATYTGIAQGRFMAASPSAYLGVSADLLSGDAVLLADFGSGDISGSLTNMVGPNGPWNSVSLLGTISGGNFTGTTATTFAPGTPGSMSGSATGTLAGTFFGPNAQELGAVWTLHDGASTAVGTIGASHRP